MGAALEAIKHESVMNLLVPFVDINKHLSQNLFYALRSEERRVGKEC